VKGVGCRVQGVGCRVFGVKCGVKGVWCKGWSVGCQKILMNRASVNSSFSPFILSLQVPESP
jgi:hypothetical protein